MASYRQPRHHIQTVSLHLKKTILIGIFEITGAFTRYLLNSIFSKIAGKKSKALSYFMNDKKGQVFANLTNDYANGIIGFTTIGLFLFLLYLVFG